MTTAMKDTLAKISAQIGVMGAVCNWELMKKVDGAAKCFTRDACAVLNCRVGSAAYKEAAENLAELVAELDADLNRHGHTMVKHPGCGWATSQAIA
jgi:hypothetical protein